ncbi:hypothetical protein BD770DRAFT_468375 [Pilaira anomala]|nr:hypothetical protein BD770DRAFT_468375 [Pilaira anomala]
MDGTKNSFSDNEKFLLMSIMRKCIPIGPNHWKKVEKEYNACLTEQGFPERHCTFVSLEAMWDRLNEIKKPTGNPTAARIEREVRQLNAMIDKKAGSKSIGIPAHLVQTVAEFDEEEGGSDGGAGPSNTLESIRSRPWSTFRRRTMDDIEREQTPLFSSAVPVALPGLLNLSESPMPKRGVRTPRGNKRNAKMNFLEGAITEMLDIMKGKRDAVNAVNAANAANAANERRIASLKNTFEATNAALSVMQQQMATMTEVLTVLVSQNARQARDDDEEEGPSKRQRKDNDV